MSQENPLARRSLLLHALGALLIVVAMAVAGGLVGRLSAPTILPKASVAPETAANEEVETAVEPESAPVIPALDPPIYLQLGIGSGSVWEALEKEITLASAAGVYRYMVPVALPWSDDETITESLTQLERIHALNPDAEFTLELDFNPPATWFEQHPDARMAGVVGDTPMPTPASVAWLDAARAAFDRLHTQLQGASLNNAVSGFVLEGLQQGRWQCGELRDDSQDNILGFRGWLARLYEDDGALKKAWSNDDVTLEAVVPPEPRATEGAPASFLRLKEDADLIDYATYRATVLAESIAALASHVRGRVGESNSIWATYGYTFEMASSTSGHLGMGVLLDSDLNGFVAPVSLANRGIGGSGGYMGPVHSAIAHGKRWLIIDDTRTGYAWNDETSKIEQIRGLRPEDVQNVQRRNFALAAVHGLDLAWSDPDGRGALSDEGQWDFFQGLVEIYRDHVAYPGSRTEHARQTYPEDMPENDEPTIMVVVDEAAQFLCDDSGGLGALLATNRDEILKTGVRVEFCLLDDMVEFRVPPTPVYLFLNAYQMPAEKRKLLHERFAEEKATAIWVYAPGYQDVTLMPDNISDTIGMKVKTLDEGSATGSTFALSGGHWLDEGQVFGTPRGFNPLFYVDDEEADVLARYKQSEKPSVAMRTMEEGWTSVYIAEPELAAPMLREILRILEQQVYFRPGKQRFFDVTVAHQNLLAIHASQDGERIVNLGRFHNIQDLFDPAIGWPQKESFVLNLKAGETRLLELSPL